MPLPKFLFPTHRRRLFLLLVLLPLTASLVVAPAIAETAPIAGCTQYDLTGEFGGPGAGFTSLLIGDAQPPILAERTFDGLEVTSLDSGLLDSGDNATFVYRSIDNDFRVVTPRPFTGDTFFTSDPATEAGVMVRWAEHSTAPRASVTYRPLDPAGPSVRFEVRGPGATDRTEIARVPLADIDQLAIDVIGDTVTGLVSRDNGTTFEALGSASLSVLFGGVRVGDREADKMIGRQAAPKSSGWGLAGVVSTSASYDPAVVPDPASYVFPFLDICAASGPAPRPDDDCFLDNFADGIVDAGWTLTGLGNANQISVSENAGELALIADGATAFTGADNAGYLYRSAEGDHRAEVTIARDSLQFLGGPLRKAGLMLRADLDSFAPRVLAQYVPNFNGTGFSHLQFVAREVQGGPGNVALANDVVFPFDPNGQPIRLAIVRRADVVSVEYSFDGGATWATPTGHTDGALEIDLPSTALWGLDTVSNDISTASAAFFDDFLLCDLCFEDDFEDGTIDAEWTLDGIGNANQVSAVETGGVLELTADGATAFYGADNAGFLYQTVTGDFRLEATIDGTTMTTGGLYRKAGLMVRESLDPWAPRLIAQLAPFWLNQDETHLQFVARDAQFNPGRLPVARDVIGVPRVVRLAIERQGDVFKVEYSTDGGATWIQPTTGFGGSITLPIADTLLVGLDMVSNDISTTSTARFDDVVLCFAEPR